MFIPIFLGYIYLESDISFEIVIITVAILSVLSFSIIFIHAKFIFYVLSFVLGFFGICLLFIGYFKTSSIILLASGFALLPVIRRYRKDELYLSIFSSSFFIIILLLSSSLRIIQSTVVKGIFDGYIFSIYDNVNPLGVPFTYSFGLVISFGRLTVTLSPLTIFLFSSVAYLTASNTMRILKIYKSFNVGGLLPLSLSVLSCQCETTIGILSGTASAYLISFLPVLIIPSLLFLIITNLYLRNRLKFNIKFIDQKILFTLLLILILIESYIIFSGMIVNILYLGVMTFISIIIGIIMGLIIPLRIKHIKSVLVVATLLEIFSMLPFLLPIIFKFLALFELYSISAILAGFLFSEVAKRLNNRFRLAIFEFVFSMQAMMGVAVLYVFLYYPSLFYNKFIQYTYFSLIILLMSIPAMWIFNLKLLGERLILINAKIAMDNRENLRN